MWRWKTKNNEALRILEEIINKIQDLSNWYVIQITGINRIRDIQTPPPHPSGAVIIKKKKAMSCSQNKRS